MACAAGRYGTAGAGQQPTPPREPATLPIGPGRAAVKLDRRQSEARSEEFIKAREAARLPDDAGGFRVCGEVVT
jgi:hypothetical protein